MENQDRLSNLILTHWRNYQPKMLAQFERDGRLEKELNATAEAMAEMLYDLTVVQKLSYHQAWEIAVSQFLLAEPEEELSSTNQN